MSNSTIDGEIIQLPIEEIYIENIKIMYKLNKLKKTTCV